MSDGNGKRLDEALNSKLALIAARFLAPALLGVLVAMMGWQISTLGSLSVAVARVERDVVAFDRRLTMIENRR